MRGFDRAQPVTRTEALILWRLGFEVAMRYYRLNAGGDSLGADERDMLLATGYAIVPIGQHLNNAADQFSAALGSQHGAAWRARAEEHEQPRGTPIVGVVVDFDAQPSHFPQILDYANEVIAVLQPDWPCWMYGPRWLLEYASVEWQAIVGLWHAAVPTAWSGGTNRTLLPLSDVTQWRNGVDFAGVGTVDVNIFRTPARLWRIA